MILRFAPNTLFFEKEKFAKRKKIPFPAKIRDEVAKMEFDYRILAD